MKMIKINQDKIKNKILRWSNSERGKNRQNKLIQSNIPTNTSLYENIEKYLDYYTELFQTILNSAINEANQNVKSGTSPIKPPIFSSPKFHNNGVYKIEIKFTPIKRKSLYSEGYSEGAYNLTRLLDVGYIASNYVYETTEIDGKKIRKRSLKKRSGMHFTRRACIRFNSMTPANITAIPYWY